MTLGCFLNVQKRKTLHPLIFILFSIHTFYLSGFYQSKQPQQVKQQRLFETSKSVSITGILRFRNNIFNVEGLTFKVPYAKISKGKFPNEIVLINAPLSQP
jgi:hypothetical protein